jgi:thioredoxin reductase (NADPH)
MHDLIIIGGGPAGLTAGLYTARARLNVVLLERLAPGGQVLTTDWVENYPGFPDGISGFELVERMKTQAENFDLPIQLEEVMGFEFSPEKKIVITNKGRLEAKTLIIATGATPKKLGIEGEELLTGKGVSYCATCDGPFYSFLTRFASTIHLAHRRDELRAIKLLQDRAMAQEKIKFIWDTIPLKILGENGVEGIELKNVKTGEISRTEVQGVFIFIGTVPNADPINGKVEQDENGFVITDEMMETSVPGVFAAGDIRSKPWRQISTAVGEGATASFYVEKYLEDLQQSSAPAIDENPAEVIKL